MVIEGTLSDFPLGELLFFLSNKQRSGWLALSTASMTFELRLSEGRIVAARSSDINPQELRRHLAACVLRLLVASDGRFSFEHGLPDPRDVPVDLSVERDVLAAIRRAGDWTEKQGPRAPLRLHPDCASNELTLPVALD